MVYNEKNLQDQKTIYKLQKIIVVMLLIILALCYKVHDINEEKSIKNIDYLQLYYDEFNNQYIIDIEGEAFTIPSENEIFINEYDDFKTLNNKIVEIVKNK